MPKRSKKVELDRESIEDTLGYLFQLSPHTYWGKTYWNKGELQGKAQEYIRYIRKVAFEGEQHEASWPQHLCIDMCAMADALGYWTVWADGKLHRVPEELYYEPK